MSRIFIYHPEILKYLFACAGLLQTFSEFTNSSSFVHSFNEADANVEAFDTGMGHDWLD